MTTHALDIRRLLAETFLAQVEFHAVIGSTNDRAKELAAQGPGKLPLLIVADMQTAGRGRGSNRWWTGRGSLAFSLLLDVKEFDVDRACWPLVGIAAGVATVEAVRPALEGCRVGLHWPNDVFADGRKLAGILVEVVANRYHVVGIGVNTNNRLCDAPPELRPTVITLWELTGVEHDHTQILLALLGHFAESLGLLATDPEQVGVKADQLCLQHGKLLTLRAGRQTATGRCVGIAPDGALLLDTPQGRQRFLSGVVLPNPEETGMRISKTK